MELDFMRLVSTVVSVLGAIIPAVWYLSTRMQKLQGSYEGCSMKIEEKISNLERSISNMDERTMKTYIALNELRERVVILEVKGERDT